MTAMLEHEVGRKPKRPPALPLDRWSWRRLGSIAWSKRFGCREVVVGPGASHVRVLTHEVPLQWGVSHLMTKSRNAWFAELFDGRHVRLRSVTTFVGKRPGTIFHRIEGIR